jgi:methionyl-tRNA formyltransferase
VADDHSTADRNPWRIVIFTNIAGGGVYNVVSEVVRPMGHRIVGVITSPGPKRRRSTSYLDVVAAVSPGIDILVSNHPDRWADVMRIWQPDLIISGGMPWLIPEDVLAIPRLGGLNMHPSLLPRHRGPNAIDWAFRSGDPELGFTIHRLEAEFDTGPILAQTRVPIHDEDDFDSLSAKFFPLLPGLLDQALERVARGEPGEPQDESLATYAGLFEPEWRTIAWTEPASAVHNKVRSWSGFGGMPKGALGDVEGETLVIVRTKLVPAGRYPSDAAPGTVLEREGNRIVVQCGDGPIMIVNASPSQATRDANGPSKP